MEGEAKFIFDKEPEVSGTNINASKFAESYASFNRIINGLQRQYIELKEEFTAQNEKLAEANLKLVQLTESNLNANEFLHGILNSIPVGVITIDPGGVVTHLNPAGSIMLNKDVRQAVGRPYREVMPEGDNAALGAQKALNSQKEVSSFEKSLTINSERVLKLSVSTAILKDESGNCTGAVEVFQDLTKIRRMEQEIARLNTLAALGEMAATIAHEVRNPLSGIGGFAALLERDFEPTDPKVALIQKIKKGVETLNQTVTKLLNYTRFNELTRVETSYLPYLKTLIDQFRHEQASRGNNCIVIVEDSSLSKFHDVIVSIDKLLYRQSLVNILTNSIEAVGQEAKINISLNTHHVSKVPTALVNKISLDFDETLLVTTISDNGPGIRSEHRDKIFAPFFTTKGSGSGLGLAVAWKLVKAHGGDIVLQDEPGAGASFQILLPARLDGIIREKT